MFIEHLFWCQYHRRAYLQCLGNSRKCSTRNLLSNYYQDITLYVYQKNHTGDFLIRVMTLCLCFCLYTGVVPECLKSSATTYYWYREALNISNSISEGGGLNWKMTVCLLAAWSMVCLAMIKGIQSSGKVNIVCTIHHFG